MKMPNNRFFFTKKEEKIVNEEKSTFWGKTVNGYIYVQDKRIITQKVDKF